MFLIHTIFVIWENYVYTGIQSARQYIKRRGGMYDRADYTEQSSWLLFLKYLDDLEGENTEAELKGTDYHPIISDEYRWLIGPPWKIVQASLIITQRLVPILSSM